MFRLYPLYLLTIGIAVALWMTHVGGLRDEDSDAATSVLSQMLMMSNVLAGTNLPNVEWSLSYEMIFYLLLTALFVARVHRCSSRYVLGFAVAAVALGGLLPQAYFTDNVASPRVIALVADLVVLTVLLSVCSLTYLFVERPMQSAGRRLARWLDARFGPDRASAPVLILAHPRAVAE